MLREEFPNSGNEKGLKKLNHALSLIKMEELDKVPAAGMLEAAKELLDQLWLMPFSILIFRLE